MGFASYNYKMEEVARAFLRKERMTVNTAMSSGEEALYSYGTIIAYRVKGEVVLNTQHYSSTTALHQRAIRETLCIDYPPMTNGEDMKERNMWYHPRTWKKTEVDWYTMQGFIAAVKLLKGAREYKALGKRFEKWDEEKIATHNKEAARKRRRIRHDKNVEYFIKNTKISKMRFKFEERGSLGKIIGRKFYIMGMRETGDLFKLMAMRASGWVEGADLSVPKDIREWGDGNLRVTSYNKVGVRLNGKFITHKQLTKMIREGDTSAKV